MKTTFISLFLVASLIGTQPIFGQSPGATPTDFGTTGETNDNSDDSAVPIDNALWLLLALGIAFVFYKHSSRLPASS